jgi:hypothetical protein
MLMTTSTSLWRRSALGLALIGCIATAGGGPGCAVSLREPGYYTARGYEVRVVRPGVYAYRINNGWYVHDGARWHRHRWGAEVIVR